MTTTQAALIDALKEAADALQLCRDQLYHDGVMIEQSHPKRIAVTAAENCMVKIADILSAANAAPTEQAVPVLDADDGQLIEVLRGLERAYPESIFTPLTEAEIKQMGPLLDRASAGMGRHLAKFMGRAANAIERLSALSQTIAEDEPKKFPVWTISKVEEGTEANRVVSLDGFKPSGYFIKDVHDAPSVQVTGAQELPVLSDEKDAARLDYCEKNQIGIYPVTKMVRRPTTMSSPAYEEQVEFLGWSSSCAMDECATIREAIDRIMPSRKPSAESKP